MPNVEFEKKHPRKVNGSPDAGEFTKRGRLDGDVELTKARYAPLGQEDADRLRETVGTEEWLDLARELNASGVPARQIAVASRQDPATTLRYLAKGLPHKYLQIPTDIASRLRAVRDTDEWWDLAEDLRRQGFSVPKIGAASGFTGDKTAYTRLAQGKPERPGLTEEEARVLSGSSRSKEWADAAQRAHDRGVEWTQIAQAAGLSYTAMKGRLARAEVGPSSQPDPEITAAEARTLRRAKGEKWRALALDLHERGVSKSELARVSGLYWSTINRRMGPTTRPSTAVPEEDAVQLAASRGTQEWVGHAWALKEAGYSENAIGKASGFSADNARVWLSKDFSPAGRSLQPEEASRLSSLSPRSREWKAVARDLRDQGVSPMEIGEACGLGDEVYELLGAKPTKRMGRALTGEETERLARTKAGAGESWIVEAAKLQRQGVSVKAIARAVGVPQASAYRYVQKWQAEHPEPS